MTFFEFCYFAFGALDFFIVMVGPVTELLSGKRQVFLLIYLFAATFITQALLPSCFTYLVLASTLAFIYFFTGKKLIALCMSLFHYLLSIVLSYLSLSLFHWITGVTEAEMVTAYFIPYYIFLTVLFIFSAFCIRHLYNRFIGNAVRLSAHTDLLLLFYLTLCTLLFVYNYTYEESQGFPQHYVTVNTILFLTFFLITAIFIVLLMRILKKDARLQTQVAQYDSLQQYTTQVEELYQGIRGFKHDYINILTTMQFYIDQQDWEHLRDYYYSEILPSGQSFQDSSQTLGALSNLHIPELKSLLYNKLIKAMEKNIPVHLEIRTPIEHMSAKYVDIARVMGIYLDNAIEALTEQSPSAATTDFSDTGSVATADSSGLSIAMTSDDTAVMIVIRNRCPAFSLDIRKLGTISYSTKGTNRGLGLHIASETLQSYKNIQHDTTYDDGYFTQILKIYHEV